MSRHRRARTPGGTFFFTLTLANRSSDLLIQPIDLLRSTYAFVQQRYPFETLAICILPDHVHAVWVLPDGDTDYSKRWGLIKSRFPRGLPGPAFRSASKVIKRDKGIWQRRYWEHAIRSAADPERHVDYIHLQSGEAQVGCARLRLAAQQLPPLCRQGRAPGGLGRRRSRFARHIW